MSQGASRRPEVILLSPSLEPEEMSSNATPNTLSSVQYGLTPGRPLQRSPLAIGDPLSELADGGSFTPPPPPDALEARPLMTNFIEHSNRSSPGDVREQQDAEPLFLASVTRGHQSRARRHRDSYSDHDLVLEGFGFNARGTRRLRTAHPLAQTGHPAANDFENVQYADMLDMLSDAAEEDTAPVPPSAPRLASGSGVSPPALHRRHVPPPPWVANLVRPPPRNAAPGESQADATDMNGGSGEFARWRREVVRRRSSSAQEQFEPDQVTSATRDGLGRSLTGSSATLQDRLAWVWGSDEESFPELTASGHLNPPFTSTIRLQNPIFPNAAFSSLHRPRGGQSPPPGIFRPSAFDRSSDSIHDDGETATVPCSRLEVLELRCNGPGCGVLICSRALQPRTRHLRPQSSSSRVERRVFSTDVPPPTSAVAAIPPDATEASSTCRCKRAKLGCKTCGHALGYQILGCCRPCMSTVVSPTGKLHAFYFHHSSVRASRRPSLSSTRPLTWDALPSLQQELDQGLVGDPADWHASEYLPFWWPSPSPPDGLSADAKTSYQADRCWYHMFREQFHNKAALDAEEAFNGDSHASRSHQQGAPSIHHRDRNATCLPPASFGMLANSSELSGGTGTGGAAKRRRTYLAGR